MEKKMNETKQQLIDARRLQLMETDKKFLFEKDYEFYYNPKAFQIRVRGILFDYKNLNALYINPHCDSGDILLEY